MQKLGISLLFFTLCLTSVSFASDRSEKSGNFPNVDSILMHVNLDSIVRHLNVDSLLKVSRDRLPNVDSLMRSVNLDSIMHRVNLDSILQRVNIDSLWKANRSKIDGFLHSSSLLQRGDTIVGMGKLTPKQLDELRRRFGQNNALHNGPPRHYFAKNGERYYLDIIPHKLQGTRVDSSDVWLLKAR